MAGMVFRYEEHPFTWQRPAFYEVRRTFASGPMKEAVLGSRVEETAKGCKIISYCNYEAAPLGKLALSPKLKMSLKAMDKVLKRFEAQIQNDSQIAYRTQLTKNPVNTPRLLAALERLQVRGFRPAEVARLDIYLRAESDPKVSEFRARELGHGKEQPWINLCLAAVQEGLLGMEWRILCPYCRSNVQKLSSLSEVRANAHCSSCNISYESAFDENVEVVFSVHPAVRAVQGGTFCIGGPELSPHVATQWIFPPLSQTDLVVETQEGLYTARSLQLSIDTTVQVSTGQNFSFCLGDGQEIQIAQGGILSIENPFDYEVIWRWEDARTLPFITTAADVTMLQAFRDQFASEVLSPGEELAVNHVVVMFTDLKGSTMMYREHGDAKSYAMVRTHFEVIRRAVDAQNGTIVKTIGDAVMAVFRHTDEAVAAGLQIHSDMAAVAPTLVTKIGMHSGPALVVQANGVLDYFGRTVNHAARLQKHSHGSDLVLTEQAFESLADQTVPHERFTADVPDVGRNMELVRIYMVPKNQTDQMKT